MAGGDAFLLEVAKKAVLGSLRESDSIRYRQQILTDCEECSEVVRGIYATAVEAIEREKKVWGWMSSKYPESTLHRSVEVLQIFVDLLKRLRQIADEHASKFHSEGFTRFFGMLATELDDTYLRGRRRPPGTAEFRDGTLISAELGRGNQGVDYILRKPRFHIAELD